MMASMTWGYWVGATYYVSKESLNKTRKVAIAARNEEAKEPPASRPCQYNPYRGKRGG